MGTSDVLRMLPGLSAAQREHAVQLLLRHWQAAAEMAAGVQPRQQGSGSGQGAAAGEQLAILDRYAVAPLMLMVEGHMPYITHRMTLSASTRASSCAALRSAACELWCRCHVVLFPSDASPSFYTWRALSHRRRSSWCQRTSRSRCCASSTSSGPRTYTPGWQAAQRCCCRGARCALTPGRSCCCRSPGCCLSGRKRPMEWTCLRGASCRCRWRCQPCPPSSRWQWCRPHCSTGTPW